MSDLFFEKVVLVPEQRSSATSKSSFFASAFGLVKQTAQEWLQDKAPQLGATNAIATAVATFASIDNFMAFLLDFRL
jgi:hypothetical protein